MSHSTLKDFEILGQIGKGSYGTVYKCRRAQDKNVYVLKEIKLAGATKREIEAAVNECHILARIDSNYVVRYFDSFVENETETLWMVMELCSQGTLRDLIVNRKTRLPEDECWYYICQILLAVASIHVLKIIHRDIKSLNIFIGENPNPSSDMPYTKYLMKLGDMGVSKELVETQGLAQTLVGSPYYLSPEICRSEKYNQKSDIWALGVTFYEMMNTGKHPFLAKNQASLIVKILKGKYEQLPGDVYSQAIRDLVYWCLRMNASSRPDVFTLLALPIVKQKIQAFKLSIPPAVSAALKRAEQNFNRVVQQKRRDAAEASTADSSKEQPKSREKRLSDAMPPTNTTANTTTAAATSKMGGTTATASETKSESKASMRTPSISAQAKETVENEDFDDPAEESVPKPRSEVATYQAELEKLLADDAKLSTEQINTYNKINSFGITHQVRDELLNFFMNDDDGEEERFIKFVFGRIGYDKIELIDHMRAHVKIVRERQELRTRITDLLTKISDQ